MLPDGSKSANSDDICEVFTAHFSRLLTSENTLRDAFFEERLASFCGALPQVPHDMASRLCAPVSQEELHDCVRRLNGASAAGPDGIPARFYKTFFPLLGARFSPW